MASASQPATPRAQLKRDDLMDGHMSPRRTSPRRSGKSPQKLEKRSTPKSNLAKEKPTTPPPEFLTFDEKTSSRKEASPRKSPQNLPPKPEKKTSTPKEMPADLCRASSGLDDPGTLRKRSPRKSLGSPAASPKSLIAKKNPAAAGAQSPASPSLHLEEPLCRLNVGNQQQTITVSDSDSDGELDDLYSLAMEASRSINAKLTQTESSDSDSSFHSARLDGEQEGGTLSASDSDSDLEDLQSLAAAAFQSMQTELMHSSDEACEADAKNSPGTSPSAGALRGSDGESSRNIGFVIDKGRKELSIQVPQYVSHSTDAENSGPNATTDKMIPGSLDSHADDSKQVNVKDKASKKKKKKKRNKKESSNQQMKLASSLQSGLCVEDTVYVNVNTYKSPSLDNAKIRDLLMKPSKEAELMKKSVLQPDMEKKDSLPPYEQSLNQQRKQRRKEREMTKGKNWYHLPATELTEERKNDLMVLQMRRSLDPKRFYKAPDLRTIPKYFQFGTVVESSADFYSSRIPKKQRKRTLVEELLEDADLRMKNKKRYVEVQEAKAQSRGPYRHMKRLKKKKR